MRFEQNNMEKFANDLLNNTKNNLNDGNAKLNDSIYVFQQNFLPRYLFSSINKFFIDFRVHKEDFIYMMLSKTYEEMHNERFPYQLLDLDCSIEIINNNFEIIQINFNINQPMLAKRLYIVSNLTYSKASYFLTENTLSGTLMLCSVFVNSDQSLNRANYGQISDDSSLEKMKIIDIISR